jgi:UDP-glucose 4-epimerase
MSTVNSILITGGCGFIGTSLIAELLENEPSSHIRVLDSLVTGSEADLAEVATFSRIPPQEVANSKSGVVLIQGDIRDATLMRQCATNVGTIIHLAANTGVGPSVEDPRLDMECNVIGTFNMLEAARLNGVKKFIFASSGAPTGEVEPPIHEELPSHPVSPYGASKLAGEGYCSAYFRTFKIDTVCLRFGNVYGPRSKNKSSVVAKFVRRALAGETCIIFGDGTQTRDFIYIGDLTRAIRLSMKKDVGGETFQIATGTERTVGEIAGLVAYMLEQRGVKMKIEYGSSRLGDVMRNYSDTSKAVRMLGWQVQTPTEQGIVATLDYFMK